MGNRKGNWEAVGPGLDSKQLCYAWGSFLAYAGIEWCRLSFFWQTHISAAWYFYLDGGC